MSLCTGMKGKLKSRFVVLSDDRVLPPPPARARGKRKPDDQQADLGPKRNRGGRTTPVSTGFISGASSGHPGSNLTSVPGVTSISTNFNPATGANSLPLAISTGFTPAAGANSLPRATSLLSRVFGVPPPISEIPGPSSLSNQSSEDWASATSDDTIIQ